MEASRAAGLVVAVEDSEAVAPQEAGNMTNLAQRFLSREEQETITAAVQTAEKLTSGEIVPMVVSKSGDYPVAAVLCSASLATPLSLLLTSLLGQLLWIGPSNMWFFLTLFALIFTPLYYLSLKNDRLKSFFLNETHVETEVSKSALAAFYSQGLYKTAADNGILLYISVLEKKVWILADSGISEIIPQENWDTVVEELTAEIKEGKQCEAICRAIESIGNILKTHFPYQKNDKDELHNLIID